MLFLLDASIQKLSFPLGLVVWKVGGGKPIHPFKSKSNPIQTNKRRPVSSIMFLHVLHVRVVSRFDLVCWSHSPSSWTSYFLVRPKFGFVWAIRSGSEWFEVMVDGEPAYLFRGDRSCNDTELRTLLVT